MSNPKTTLAARLRQARERTDPKLTQEEVAARIGVSSWSVSNWENDGVPAADKLADFAELYGVSTDWLLGLRDEAPAPRAAPAAELAPVDMAWFAQLMNQTGAVAMREMLRGNGDSLRATNVVMADADELARLEQLVDQRLAQREGDQRHAS